MPTCIWTHEATDRAVPVTLNVPSSTGGQGAPRTLHVLPEHEADLRAYNASVTRWGQTMLVGVLGLSGVLLAVGVGAAVAGWPDRVIAGLSGGIIVAMSGLLIAFPFATPQTIEMMGIRSSIRLTRILAALMAAFALWLALYG